MNSKEIQKQLFQKIHQHIAPVNLADELTELFNTTLSGAYRRIKGETLLSIEELVRILEHYPFLSFEKFVRPNQISYTLPCLTTQPHNMLDYLSTIERDLKQITIYPKAFISYVAQEVPFFHYLMVPEIAAFKMYMWSRTVWNVENLLHASFDLEKYRQDDLLLNQMKRIVSLYASVETKEIWNSNMFDITLNQIRHCYLAGLFKKGDDDVREIFVLLRGLIQKLRDIVVLGQKKGNERSAKCTVWYNELMQNSAFILFHLSENVQLVYNIFDAPNFMQSSDFNAFDYSQTFFDKLSGFALPLTGGVSERNMPLFFDRLNRKMDIFEHDLFFYKG